MMIPKRPKHKHAKRRKSRRITPFRIVGLFSLVAALGLAGFLFVKGSGGGGSQDQAAMGDMSGVAMTPAPTAATTPPAPFAGGGRLYLPVTGVDLGHVPLMTNVSYSFDLLNVGDQPLSLTARPNVKALEGC